MLHSTSCFKYLFALWVLASSASLAQETAHLNMQPDRLRKAKDAEREAKAKNDPLLLAEAWYLYGKAYVFAGDYQTSQGYFLQSLKLLEPWGNSDELSRIYVRLSENEGRLGHAGDALRYANLALATARRIGSLSTLARAYGVMGRLYEERWTGQNEGNRAIYDSVLYYYRSQEFAFRALSDTMGLAETSLELGTLFTKTKNIKALTHFEKALHLVNLLHRDRMKVNVLMHLASAYLTFGKPQLAFQTLRAAEKLYIANRVDEYDTILGLEKEYVLYYQTTGEWKEAFAHQKQMNDLINRQLMSDHEGTVAQLNVAYETQKKQTLLNIQAENLQTQQRFTLAMSALFVLSTSMSFIFFRLYRKNQRISRQNEELVKEQNHRVKNNLQVVSSLLSLQSKRLTDETAKKAVEESRLRVESMAILHRRLYDGDKFARVNVDQFIQELVGGVLKSYGYYTVDAQFIIDDITLSADKAVPLGLILNELTTNVCKYAFPDNENPQLSISCHQTNNKIELTVADNGPGLDSPGRTDAQMEQSASCPSDVSGLEKTELNGENVHIERNGTFGLQLIQAQVEQLNGTSQFNSNTETVFPDTGLMGTSFTLKFST